MSDKIIDEMEKESLALRNYLRSLNLISDEELEKSRLRELKSRQEIAKLRKVRSTFFFHLPLYFVL